jgi:ParB family chromosome partitioning protein
MGLDLSALESPPPADAARWVAPVAALSAFEEDPDNPRFEDEDGDFDVFVADVRRRGILQPVVVRLMPSGRLRLRFGHRRYRAACVLALAGLSYVVTEDPRQFDDYAQVAENQKHKTLQPLELGAFVLRKLAQGEKKKEVAARLDLDASAITHLLALADEPPPVLLELYHSRRCRTPQYLYELRKLLEVQPDLVAARAASAELIDRAWLARVAAEVRGRQQHVSTQNKSLPEAQSVGQLAQKQPSTLSGLERLHQPVLLGSLDGKPLRLLLEYKPRTAGMIWACLDGALEPVEIALSKVQLTFLEEGRQARLRLVHGGEVSPGLQDSDR